jgi:hypothetical protein
VLTYGSRLRSVSGVAVRSASWTRTGARATTLRKDKGGLAAQTRIDARCEADFMAASVGAFLHRMGQTFKIKVWPATGVGFWISWSGGWN